ncbi:hypothetical protein P280DRAFT_514538 [Massarina eburnea CBS 473.64]|uniref:Mediator complex subunit 27 n=1 Tax=Massarina eburnea CBS 473.64 TaxID=1395130 RepID=A0A6A6SBB4_9PLEO|nr:hypothetical protein P280DRAFT_514538 [Massarina eburnea CBS 473.64]
MASTNPTPTTQPQPQLAAAWDEAQLTSALAHLERLQSQLDSLRFTIPRVLQPFHAPPTPSLFRAFSDNLTASQNDIKDFRKQWQNHDTQTVFQYKRDSLKKDGNLSLKGRGGVDVEEVKKYGWVDREARMKQREGQNGVEKAVESEVLGQADINKIVAEWKGGLEKIAVESKDGDKDLTIMLIASSLRLHFQVLVTQEENGSYKLNAECLGTDVTRLAITRCIKTRPKTNDLRYLLDMIVAYKTVRGTSCFKCERMLDGHAMWTVGRRSREVVGEGKTEVVWEALHEGCLP